MTPNPKDLLQFPKLLALLVWSLIYYTFMEVETFLAAVVAALYGWHFGWEWGVTIYFTLYFAMRMLGGYVSLIASKLHMIGLVMTEQQRKEQAGDD